MDFFLEMRPKSFRLFLARPIEKSNKNRLFVPSFCCKEGTYFLEAVSKPWPQKKTKKHRFCAICKKTPTFFQSWRLFFDSFCIEDVTEVIPKKSVVTVQIVYNFVDKVDNYAFNSVSPTKYTSPAPIVINISSGDKVDFK